MVCGSSARRDDTADSGKEAHVEHAIDLVEDEHFDGADVTARRQGSLPDVLAGDNQARAASS